MLAWFVGCILRTEPAHLILTVDFKRNRIIPTEVGPPQQNEPDPLESHHAKLPLLSSALSKKSLFIPRIFPQISSHFSPIISLFHHEIINGYVFFIFEEFVGRWSFQMRHLLVCQRSNSFFPRNFDLCFLVFFWRKLC